MAEQNRHNTSVLAFIGDAVYELYVRKHVLEMGSSHADELHKLAVKYVSAPAQAEVIKVLMESELTEEELKLVKRARNHKASSSKKTRASHRGTDIVTDKLATAYEALIGWLYVSEDIDRLEQLILRSFEITEG